MNSFVRHIVFPSLMVACAIPVATSQVRRVAIESAHRAQESYVDVYEYDYVDVQPHFPGGDRGLINFINKTRRYPYEAYKHQIQGRVICSFIVNTDGSLCNISVIKGICPSLDREAMRVIKAMPQWKAGRISGQEVPVHCILPIAFRL